MSRRCLGKEENEMMQAKRKKKGEDRLNKGK